MLFWLLQVICSIFISPLLRSVADLLCVLSISATAQFQCFRWYIELGDERWWPPCGRINLWRDLMDREVLMLALKMFTINHWNLVILSRSSPIRLSFFCGFVSFHDFCCIVSDALPFAFRKLLANIRNWVKNGMHIIPPASEPRQCKPTWIYYIVQLEWGKYC